MKMKNENRKRFSGISWTRYSVAREGRRGKEREERKKETEARKVVAAVVDCGALTLAGHKAISKFHLF